MGQAMATVTYLSWDIQLNMQDSTQYMQIHLGDILTKFFVLYENFIRYYWRTCEPTSNLYLWYKTGFGDAYYHLTIPCFNLTTEEDLVTGESEDYYNDHYDYYGDYDYTFDVNEFYEDNDYDILIYGNSDR